MRATTLEHPAPRIVVSKCLGFAACRYNGQVIPNRLLESLAAHAELVEVCPEVEIGLGTPRDPIHVVGGDGGRRLVQPSTGRDLTGLMEEFRDRWLATVPADVEGFVLKSRSPSCALTDAKIHAPRPGQAPLGKGPGLFAEAVLERFPLAAVEDEGRLTNWRIREHFLTRVFAFARLRRVRTMGELVRFQARHKLILMAASQKELRALGRTVANPAKLPFADVLAAYREGLGRALARPPRYTSHINVIMHALGYFKKGLGAAEKAHFLDLLQQYRESRVPLAALTGILRSWVARFGEDYLADQHYFEPCPRDLVEVGDSGKGRNR